MTERLFTLIWSLGAVVVLTCLTGQVVIAHFAAMSAALARVAMGG